MKFSWIRVATMKNIIFILLTVAILSGCAAQSSLTPAMEADLTKPLYCNNPDECKVMWKRALQFVSRNAGYKVKKANAALIETGGPSYNNQSYKLSMRVTKSPLGTQKHQLKVQVWCVRGISIYRDCRPSAEETLWRALVFIKEGRQKTSSMFQMEVS